MLDLDFDALFDKLAPHGTVRYTLTGVCVYSAAPVVLVLKHAGESNTPYMNALRKQDATREASSGGADPEIIKTQLIELFAKHVVVAWENVHLANGQSMPCTPDQVSKFLTAMARKNVDIFGRIVAFARDADNFRDAPAIDSEALGKE